MLLRLKTVLKYEINKGCGSQTQLESELLGEIPGPCLRLSQYQGWSLENAFLQISQGIQIHSCIGKLLH